MKFLIMLMVILFAAASNAMVMNSANEELFSPIQNERIVKAIDYICGDIWCEGYYDYKFIALSCDKNDHNCDLSFKFKESFDDQRVQFSPVQICHLEGILSYEQVMEDENYLQFSFIDKLNNCFEDLALRYHAR